jgi:hypothetical protein
LLQQTYAKSDYRGGANKWMHCHLPKPAFCTDLPHPYLSVLHVMNWHSITFRYQKHPICHIQARKQAKNQAKPEQQTITMPTHVYQLQNY